MKIDFYPLGSLPDAVGEAWEQQIRERYGLLPLTLSIDWLRGITADRPGDAVIAVMSASESSGKGWVLPLLLSAQSLLLRIGPVSFGRLTLPIAKVYGGDCDLGLIEQGQLPALLTAILLRNPALQGVMFDHVPEGPKAVNLKRTARKAGYGVGQVFTGMPHYRLLLPPSCGEFKAMRSGDSLKKIRKHERLLSELAGAPCRLIEFRSPVDWGPFRGALEQLAATCWQARYLEHGLDIKELGRLANHGWVRLFVLAVGEKFVAFVSCYQGKDSLIREQSGYDPEYAKFYPGELLLHKMVERLYETERPAVIDFGVGEGYHKRMAANEVTRVEAILLLRAGMLNKIKWGLYANCRAADQGLRRISDWLRVKRYLTRYFKRKI